MTKRILIIISIVVIIVAGRYIYKAIYPPIVAVDPQVQTIKQEVIKDRIIIKEVIKDAKQEAVQHVAALSDDAVADELNARLSEYRKRRSGTTE
ncbi:MAG TPA: hypothetical protein VFC96_02485 [Anaerovoracaceae bacterium]|nr:hypothetical protein [Anaerovoracaceae bacterium]